MSQHVQALQDQVARLSWENRRYKEELDRQRGVEARLRHENRDMHDDCERYRKQSRLLKDEVVEYQKRCVDLNSIKEAQAKSFKGLKKKYKSLEDDYTFLIQKTFVPNQPPPPPPPPPQQQQVQQEQQQHPHQDLSLQGRSGTENVSEVGRDLPSSLKHVREDDEDKEGEEEEDGEIQDKGDSPHRSKRTKTRISEDKGEALFCPKCGVAFLSTIHREQPLDALMMQHLRCRHNIAKTVDLKDLQKLAKDEGKVLAPKIAKIQRMIDRLQEEEKQQANKAA